MQKQLPLALSFVALSVMGIGCNPFAGVQEKINQKIGESVVEKMIKAGSGGKIDVDAEDGGLSFKDPKTGETISLGTNAKIPAGFPTDIPKYEGAQVSIASLTKDGSAVLAVTIRDVEPKVLAEWYDEQIRANGFERKSETPVAETLFHEYRKSDAKLIMAILGEKAKDGRWAANVQITRSKIAQ
jgi:hypothetical protein